MKPVPAAIKEGIKVAVEALSEKDFKYKVSLADGTPVDVYHGELKVRFTLGVVLTKVNGVETAGIIFFLPEWVSCEDVIAQVSVVFPFVEKTSTNM